MVSVSDVATKASEQPKTDGSTAPEAAVIGPVMKALSDFVVELVKADGGELYLVAATPEAVHLHLKRHGRTARKMPAQAV